VLAGSFNDGLFRSEVGGTGWVRSVQGLNNARVTGMVFSTKNEVYASTTTGGGVYKSTDGGVTWNELANASLGSDQVNGLMLHPSNPRILFALTNGAGLRRINLDAPTNWLSAVEISTEGSPPEPELPALYAAGQTDPDEELFVPGDEAYALALDTAASVTAPVLSMAFAPSNASIAYAGTNGSGLWKSIDGGTNWTKTNQPASVVRGVAVHQTNPNIVYAATHIVGKMLVTYDGGINWTTLNLPDQAADPYSIATTPADPGSVYIGTNYGVYRYNGASWSLTGLNGLTATHLAAHPGNPQLLAAATAQGAYVYQIGIAGWMLADSQLSAWKRFRSTSTRPIRAASTWAPLPAAPCA
jgi:photosystem II stability/assembly factor-like uncharacterized protein